MTDDLWKNAKNGDWASALNWSDGVPTNTADAAINLAGQYIVTISTAVSAHDVMMNALSATLLEQVSGSLSADTLTLETGTAILNGDSSIGSIDLNGGLLECGSDQALGSAAINLFGGIFQATASTTISETVALLDTNGSELNISAAAGTTVQFGNWNLGSGGHHLVINAPQGTEVDSGTILWFGGAGVDEAGAGPTTMDIQAGIFQVLGGQLDRMLIDDLHIAANATLDTGDSKLNLDTLNINASGVLTDSTESEPAVITVLNGSVDGLVTGNLAVNSAAGGTLTLSGDNSYTQGTVISGTVIATQDASLGSGNIDFDGGTLIVQNNARLAALDSHYGVLIQGATLAAAHGTVMVFDPYALDVWDGPIIFGDANGDDGKVVFGVQGGRLVPHEGEGLTEVEVKAGTLTASTDGGLSELLSRTLGTQIDAGATLDAHSHLHRIVTLTGAGRLINSAKSDTVALSGTTNFTGTISGAFDFTIDGAARLYGNEAFTGKATLSAGSSLTIGHLWSEEVDFAGAAKLLLDRPSDFSGLIGRFGTSDAIDLTNLSKKATLNWDAKTHTLTITGTAHTVMLAFDGDYEAANFRVVNDGTGHAELVYHATSLALEHTGDLWG